MIGLEWGQHNFRAFRLGRDGAIRDQRISPRGTARVQDRRFGDTLREAVGPWLAAGEQHILLTGSVLGPDGWAEVPTIACPAGAAEIAAALTPIGFDWAEVRALPRLACSGPDHLPQKSGGEEASFLAALALLGDAGLACLPGARSRWVRVAQHRIASFTTHITGEVFAALRPATPAGKLARDPIIASLSSFDAGLDRASRAGGLLYHLAAVRSPSAQRQGEDEASSFLFGLLVGHEVRAALALHAPAAPVAVIGGSDLAAALYARAIATAGGLAEALDGEASARGFALVGTAAGLS